ncbi:MAG: CDP-alcohol phosphatidyltransferase family protein [Candidatus Planktophila sp.]
MSNLTPNVARRAGYALHVLTASGAVIGMLALQGVVNGEIRIALLWLIVSQILDGLDGPIARGLDVEIHAPLIDGQILDLVVDYVTCVVVPVAFMLKFEMLPVKYEALIAGFIFLTSALWFARSDIETDDHWFNGFPAVWNLAVPTFLVFRLSPAEVAIYTLILGMSQLTYFKVPHIVRVSQLRRITLPFSVLYLGNLTYLSWNYSKALGVQSNILSDIILIAFPIYLFAFGIYKTWSSRLVRQ